MKTLQAAVECNPHADHQWTIYASADDQDVVLGQYNNPDDVRGHLFDMYQFDEDDCVTLVDADGNGSNCVIPIAWIGDGEPLVGSDRVLEKI